MFKIVTALALQFYRRTDAPERPIFVAPPCQSDIKRTLRAAAPQPDQTRTALFSRGFRLPAQNAFDPNGERPVSAADRLWFRNGGRTVPIARPSQRPSIENLRRIKSDAFFTNFRRINLNANTGDLWMAASQEPIARHQAQRIKTDG
jgi:hypothetical protein